MSIKQAKKRAELIHKCKKDIQDLKTVCLDSERIVSNIQCDFHNHRQMFYNINSELKNELNNLNNDVYDEFHMIYSIISKKEEKQKLLIEQLNAKINLFIIIFVFQIIIIALIFVLK